MWRFVDAAQPPNIPEAEARAKSTIFMAHTPRVKDGVGKLGRRPDAAAYEGQLKPEASISTMHVVPQE